LNRVFCIESFQRSVVSVYILVIC